MSTFVGWPGVVRWRKQASVERLIIESNPNVFFPIFPGICDFIFFLLKSQKRLALMVDETDLPNVSSKRS